MRRCRVHNCVRMARTRLDLPNGSEARPHQGLGHCCDTAVVLICRFESLWKMPLRTWARLELGSEGVISHPPIRNPRLLSHLNVVHQPTHTTRSLLCLQACV
ncbi:hypothetical protein L1887_53365 [Cichorium endivia]|nr:hypothetical protein L1887_53365 [Cichorium endivia]